jgi:hypothetical protein
MELNVGNRNKNVFKRIHLGKANLRNSEKNFRQLSLAIGTPVTKIPRIVGVRNHIGPGQELDFRVNPPPPPPNPNPYPPPPLHLTISLQHPSERESAI